MGFGITSGFVFFQQYGQFPDRQLNIGNLLWTGDLPFDNQFTREIERSWIFRSVGYGHDYTVWKDIVSNLRLVGYDDVLSIEHEDSLMTPTEGLQKAISFLKEVLIFDAKNTDVFWA